MANLVSVVEAARSMFAGRSKQKIHYRLVEAVDSIVVKHGGKQSWEKMDEILKQSDKAPLNDTDRSDVLKSLGSATEEAQINATLATALSTLRSSRKHSEEVIFVPSHFSLNGTHG